MTNHDAVSNLALFLLERTGSVCGFWHGKMKADQQRALFGCYIGKGTILIDGARETLCNRVSVGFGQDYDDRNITSWKAL